MSFEKGLSVRRTPGGVMVAKLHYTADPDRNSQRVEQERRKYSSQADSERDQIIRDAFETGNQATLAIRLAQFDERERVKAEPVSYRPHWPINGEF